MAERQTCPKEGRPLNRACASGRAQQRKVTAILQGRLGSTRLPGKVMLPLSGKPVIQHVYDRVAHCRRIDRIIVATTTHPRDDIIARMFEGLGVSVFRGSGSDPLDRYYQAATDYGASDVVRIMADCPLVDPRVVDRVIDRYFAGGHDFCCLGGGFPCGLDTTVFSYAALALCWKNARRLSEREHVTPYMTNHPELFNLGVLEIFQELYHLRWTIDHQTDYEFMVKIYDALYRPGKIFLSLDVINLLEMQPDLVKINAMTPRDEGYRKSLEQEQHV